MSGVSVIICCYNSAQRLLPTLQHLQQQIFQKKIAWEIILVDNASTDETTSLANRIWSENPITEFRVVNESEPGLMPARKRGIRESKFQYLTFIDDDNWVNPNWIEKVFDIFESNSIIAACGGPSEAIFESNRPEWFEHYAVSFAVGKQYKKTGLLQGGKVLWGAGLSIRKSVLEQLNKFGFISQLSGRKEFLLTAGEDSELCLAIQVMGLKLWYDEQLTLKHFMPSSRLQLPRLFLMNEGFGKAEVILRIYRAFFNSTIVIHKPWWKEYLATAFYYVKFSIFNGRKKNAKPFWSKAEKSFIAGYCNEIWKLKSEYDKIIRQTESFRSKCII